MDELDYVFWMPLAPERDINNDGKQATSSGDDFQISIMLTVRPYICTCNRFVYMYVHVINHE